MDPAKMTALVSALAVLISENITDEEELITFAIALDLLGDNIDAIVAQRALARKNEDIGIIALEGRRGDRGI